MKYLLMSAQGTIAAALALDLSGTYAAAPVAVALTWALIPVAVAISFLSIVGARMAEEEGGESLEEARRAIAKRWGVSLVFWRVVSFACIVGLALSGFVVTAVFDALVWAVQLGALSVTRIILAPEVTPEGQAS